jgi:hypothetical protein
MGVQAANLYTAAVIWWLSLFVFGPSVRGPRPPTYRIIGCFLRNAVRWTIGTYLLKCMGWWLHQGVVSGVKLPRP